MTAAEIEVRSRIAARGKIPFAEFMELALYHPGGGYYTSRMAHDHLADYYTSASAHPAFAASITVALLGMWIAMARPTPFHAIEMGAGAGTLATDIVSCAPALDPTFAAALRYVALDRRLHSNAPRVVQRIVSDSVPFSRVVGCFLSNELLDAFPVHRFEVRGGTVQEVFVMLEADRLVSTLAEPSTPLIQEYVEGLGIPLSEGFRGEYNPGIGQWYHGVAAALDRGFVLTIDYGYEAADLASPQRSNGSLQTYYLQTAGASPYQTVGRQDITANVDFSMVVREGEKNGLRPLEMKPQGAFLRDMGIERMAGNVTGGRYLADILDPNMLGGFKVLLQTKNFGARYEDILPASSETFVLPQTSLATGAFPTAYPPQPPKSWELHELWPPEESD